MGRAAAIAYALEGADVAINYLLAEEEDARQVVVLIEKAERSCRSSRRPPRRKVLPEAC